MARLCGILTLCRSIGGSCNLTVQQAALLKELLSGQDVKGAAAALHLSPRAVLAGRGGLLRKLGLRNRLELNGINCKYEN
ncbi:hypothetical protein FXQ12_23075 [Salmonella enterica]|nr:hypothetical protein [Salmonella enterica]ECC9414806.1 hypothetical protein [Salmonella enterica subsp. enterica]EHF1448654.1 hypothetical protein [Salmonella enterica subsp. enterica serovar 4,5,12:b:-]EHG1528607.1 hypothetical protein [Salmonella enterica subsp. enterica serovar 4,[5],12:b:-]ECD8848665.1 hypothetical protein [Salmonella enterica subsp. enterica]